MNELQLDLEQEPEPARKEPPGHFCACGAPGFISHNGGLNWHCNEHDPEAKARAERIAKYGTEARIRL